MERTAKVTLEATSTSRCNLGAVCNPFSGLFLLLEFCKRYQHHDLDFWNLLLITRRSSVQI